MASIVAPGVARFTISGTVAGTDTWANIWDCRILGSTEVDRAELCRLYAGWLLQTWDTTIATRVHEAVVATQVAWVDLDSATGSTGAVTTGLTVSGPFNGGQTGAISTTNIAGLATKNVTSARGSRNGRWYQVGYIESQIDGNIMTGANFTAAAGTYTAFLDAVTDPEEIPEGSFLPVVVHTRNDGTPTNPNIVYAGNDVIQSFVFQPRMATQRRRLRR